METQEEMLAELQRLRAENEQLKSHKTSTISMKVSPKGAVSVYGLGKFPVTLYKEQWLRVLGVEKEIRAFIDEHEAELKVKG